MGSYQAGTTMTVEALFIDERTGNTVVPDPGSLAVKFYKDGVLIHDGTSDIYQVDTNKYACDYSLPITLAKGLYVYEWYAEVSTKPCRESAIFRVRERKGG